MGVRVMLGFGGCFSPAPGDGSRSNWPPSVGLKKRGPEKRARGGVVRAPARGRSASEGLGYGITIPYPG